MIEIMPVAANACESNYARHGDIRSSGTVKRFGVQVIDKKRFDIPFDMR